MENDDNRIQVPIEELRQRSLHVLAPLYGGQCTGTFARSIAGLVAECMKVGVKMKLYFMYNESLITRARNYCADEFLRGDCSHAMFIDSDIEFDPRDVIAMLALMSDDSPYDVLCGPYPKKNISYEKLTQAVNMGVGEENPNELADYVGDFVFNAINLPPGEPVNLGRPVEVAESGTGFMMIRRKTFEKFMEGKPENFYKPDHVRTENFDGSREICMFFQAEIDRESKRYLSEDYYFCHEVRKLGMKVWLCPWIHLSHSGFFVFEGNMIKMLQMGIAPTVNRSQIKKQGKR